MIVIMEGTVCKSSDLKNVGFLKAWLIHVKLHIIDFYTLRVLTDSQLFYHNLASRPMEEKLKMALHLRALRGPLVSFCRDFLLVLLYWWTFE